MRTVMTETRLGRCPGLSEYSLGVRSFCWICHAAAHSSFTKERNVQVNCKVCPQYISYYKIPIFSDDFRHILSYNRALRVTIALNGKMPTNIQEKTKIINFF